MAFMATVRSKLSDFLFGKQDYDPLVSATLANYFQSISGYSPVYQSTDGGLYELSLCRACIHRKATESAKAKPTLTVHNRRLEHIVNTKPNPFMTASQFYYRVRTIFEIENNAFIVPIEDEFGVIVGLFPVVPSMAEIKERNGKAYIVYTFGNGDKKAIEYEKCGHLRRMQYKDDFFGADNKAFQTTADLLKAQEKGSAEAIKTSSNVRWKAKLNSQVVSDKDFKQQQKLLSTLNLNNNDTGIFLYDSRFESMDQIKANPLLLDAEQKKAIDNSAYNYWGVNEEILQNSYTEDQWNAFYESELESFFIQLGEVLSVMLYTSDQLKNGNRVLLTSDRLQYASNTTKISVAKELFDRGILTTNQALEILNMAPVEGGDVRYIRGEYHPYNSDNGGRKEVTEDGTGTENVGVEPESGNGNKTD